jgi:hypothetical protein
MSSRPWKSALGPWRRVKAMRPRPNTYQATLHVEHSLSLSGRAFVDQLPWFPVICARSDFDALTSIRSRMAADAGRSAPDTRDVILAYQMGAALTTDRSAAKTPPRQEVLHRRRVRLALALGANSAQA